MKTIITYSIIALIFFSCKKKNDNSSSSSNPNGTNYYLTAKIDGVDFSATSSSLVSYGADITVYYNITGIDNNGNRLILNLESPTSTGTFSTGTDDMAIHQVSGVYAEIDSTNTNLWSTRFRPGTGTITISQNTSTSMKGSFSFTGINPLDSTYKVFTEGKFYAKKI